jgi:hypothetical protein
MLSLGHSPKTPSSPMITSKNHSLPKTPFGKWILPVERSLADLFLSPKEDILFFTDRATHRLYRIDL